MSIPAKDTRLAPLNHHLRTVAIVFDLINPMLAFGRLIDRGRKLGLGEPESGGDAKHGLRYPAFFSGSDFSCASKSPARASHVLAWRSAVSLVVSLRFELDARRRGLVGGIPGDRAAYQLRLFR